MHLCIDVGNTNTNFALFSKDELKEFWTLPTSKIPDLGFQNQLSIYKSNIDAVAVASVAPSIDSILSDQLENILGLKAKFLTSRSVKGIKFSKFTNPNDIGADLIAAAIGGRKLFSDIALIIIDSGTASTITVLDKNNEFLGGVIFPGMSLQLSSLAANTEKLDLVHVERPSQIINSQTQMAIQAGVYYGHVGAINELVARIKKELPTKEVKILITGGNAELLKQDCQHDMYHPNLVVLGLNVFLNHI